MYNVESYGVIDPYIVTISIPGTPVECEIDSGEDRSCIPVDYFEIYLSTNLRRKSILKEKKDIERKLLVDTGSRPLMGKDLMHNFGIKNIPVETYNMK